MRPTEQVNNYLTRKRGPGETLKPHKMEEKSPDNRMNWTIADMRLKKNEMG